MAGRISPGPNAGTLSDLQLGSFTTAADGKPGVVVTNYDGSAIGQPVLASAAVVGQVAASTATQLPSNALTNGVIIQALAANTDKVYIGTSNSVSSSNGFELQPGQATSIAVNNTNLLWVVAASGTQNVCFIGS